MQVADFKTVVFRQQLLGFNAVRLPMTFSDLNLAPKSWTKPCTDDTEYLKVCCCSVSRCSSRRASYDACISTISYNKSHMLWVIASAKWGTTSRHPTLTLMPAILQMQCTARNGFGFDFGVSMLGDLAFPGFPMQARCTCKQDVLADMRSVLHAGESDQSNLSLQLHQHGLTYLPELFCSLGWHVQQRPAQRLHPQPLSVRHPVLHTAGDPHGSTCLAPPTSHIANVLPAILCLHVSAWGGSPLLLFLLKHWC